MTSTAEGNTMDPLLREIREQPHTLHAAAAGLRGQAGVLADVAARLRHADDPLVLTGMGSSLDAAQAAASVLARSGRPVLAVNTAELVHFRLPSLRPGSCVLAVSQSGRSAELVRLGERLAERDDVGLVAVTNGTDNPLAALADLTLDMTAGEEVGPATKTFTASLVVLSALTDLLGPLRPDVSGAVSATTVAAEAAAAQADRILVDAETLGESVNRHLGDAAHLVLLGRGVARASAEVGALVLKEASRTAAECMDAAEFRHGPLELAGPELAAVLVSLEPATAALDRRLLSDLSFRGSAVLAIGRRDEESDAPRLVIDPVSPLFDVALASIPLQLLAWWRAQRSARPEAFLVGAKVTTEE